MDSRRSALPVSEERLKMEKLYKLNQEQVQKICDVLKMQPYCEVYEIIEEFRRQEDAYESVFGEHPPIEATGIEK